MVTKKKILITGGSGLIGHHLIPLLTQDYSVYSLTRKAHPELSDQVKVIHCDLSGDFSTEAFPKNIDAIIHLAQSDRFRDFPLSVEDVFNVNTRTTLKLLDYGREAGAKTFLYASSGGVYGYSDIGFKEDSPIKAEKDLGFYLSTKLCSEVIAENYTPLMNVIMFRFFFVYGPGQKRSMLIPRLVDSVKNGTPITLQGPDGIRINPTYVDDAANAIKNALNLIDSQKINVGGPAVYSLKQICEIIGETVGKKPVFTVQDAKPKNIIGDIQKMSKLLGSPNVTFDEGIKRLI
jgi:UDP-glucose 4-epimerase